MRFNELTEKIVSYSTIPGHFSDILKRIKDHRDDFIMYMQDVNFKHL